MCVEHNLPSGWNRVNLGLNDLSKYGGGMVSPHPAPAVPTVLYRGAVKLVFVFENSCETIHFTTVANDL